MKSRIILVGAGGSGKDHLKQRFIDKGFKPSVSHTTRPPRSGEVEGKDYFYIDSGIFHEMLKGGEFYEFKNFNGWFYGVTNDNFNESDLFIMTPPAIKEMSPEIRATSFVIYLDVPEEVRAKRLASRNDADDVARRIRVDREMFDCFVDYDMRISDPNF